MLRVLHVMADGSQGGGASHLGILLPELRRLGVECSAAVGEGPLADALRAAGFPTRTLDLMRCRLDPAAPARLARAVAQARPALVHLHGTRAAFFGALARPVLRRPAVYTVHGLSFRKERGRARRQVFLGAELVACRAAAEVVSVSRRDLEELRARRILSPARGVHIPNAVDTLRFAPGDREAARARLELPRDAFVVGTVGRLVAGKAVEDLVAAVERLSGIFLVIAGDGPERARLEASARALGARARFLGARDDIPEVLRALDVFALASRWEGEPVALLEAMAVGLPCVATANEGARELLEGTNAGLLVPVGSAAGLGAALATLVAAPLRAREMGQAARRVALSRSAGVAAAALRAVYERVIG